MNGGPIKGHGKLETEIGCRLLKPRNIMLWFNHVLQSSSVGNLAPNATMLRWFRDCQEVIWSWWLYPREYFNIITEGMSFLFFFLIKVSLVRSCFFLYMLCCSPTFHVITQQEGPCRCRFLGFWLLSLQNCKKQISVLYKLLCYSSTNLGTIRNGRKHRRLLF